MATTKRAPLPPGRQPWDPVNGLRIGALIGALLGAGVGALVGVLELWVIALAAIAGGLLGWRSEKRKQRREERSAT